MASAPPAAVPTEARAAVDALRNTVADLHGELTRYGLVVWTAGNVSARVPGYDLMVIKPSGVAYDELSAANMVVTDLFGALRRPVQDPGSAVVHRHDHVGYEPHVFTTATPATDAGPQAIGVKLGVTHAVDH